jgi:hypothetical protein
MPLGSPIVVPHRLAILAFLFFDVLPEAGKITRNLPLLLGQASLMATDLLVQLRLLSAQTTMLFLAVARRLLLAVPLWPIGIRSTKPWLKRFRFALPSLILPVPSFLAVFKALRRVGLSWTQISAGYGASLVANGRIPDIRCLRAWCEDQR